MSGQSTLHIGDYVIVELISETPNTRIYRATNYQGDNFACKELTNIPEPI